MYRAYLTGLIATATFMMASTTAFAFGPCCCFCEEGRCQVKVEREEVETKSFDVECEKICIPPLRFPWECGPLKKCGSVRCIKKLKSTKGTKEVCVYDWSVVCCPSCYRKACNACGDGCDNFGGCDAGCCEEGCCASTGSHKEVSNVAMNEQGKPSTQSAFPAVSVALVSAVSQATPEADGWVRITKPTADEGQSLTAENDLIETSAEILHR